METNWQTSPVAEGHKVIEITTAARRMLFILNNIAFVPVAIHNSSFFFHILPVTRSHFGTPPSIFKTLDSKLPCFLTPLLCDKAPDGGLLSQYFLIVPMMEVATSKLQKGGVQLLCCKRPYRGFPKEFQEGEDIHISLFLSFCSMYIHWCSLDHLANFTVQYPRAHLKI